MGGVHIKAAPGFEGWTRLREGSFKTMNVAEIAECAAALAEDRAKCETCVKGGDGTPNHATTSTHGDFPAQPARGIPASKASAITYRCRSGSRWFNPTTRQMEGRAHCTCDYCY